MAAHPAVACLAVGGHDADRANALADRCADSARRALDWVGRHPQLDELVRSDASWLYAGHKTLAALTTAGVETAAGRQATWLVRNRLQPDGDIGAPEHRAGPARSAWLYFSSWLTWGAHRLGRFDLSVPSARFIASTQGLDGSFASNPHGPEHVVDLFVTSACGLALTETGHLEEAAAAAAFLEESLDEDA